MNKKPYISICIPTYNRLEILKKTIESIYADLIDVNMEDFEVIISDNEPNNSAKEIIQSFNYDNLHYFESQSKGFLNSYDVLKFGSGLFLKLHNNYITLRSGTLKKLINEVKVNLETKPVIFFTNGLKQFGSMEKFEKFDSFMFKLSYFSSWSSGFGIWKDDFDKISKRIELNEYFPHTSLLIAQAYKSSYLIDDLPYFKNQNVPNKGGYNIFEVFSLDYVSLLKDTYLKNEISKITFDKIKKDLLFDYLSVRYFKTVIIRIDKFKKNDIKKNIKIHYKVSMFYIMVFKSFFTPLKIFKRKINVFRYTKNLK